MINFKEPEEVEMILNKYKKSISDSLSLPEKRYYLVKEVLKSEPLPPYEKCKDSYSNAGFIAASLMLEKVTKQSWESLIIKLSKDLKLGIHIGSPVGLGIHQPKGHINPQNWVSNKDLISVNDKTKVLPGDFYEFLQLCTPAGDISINTKGFIKFLQLNINGINGKDNYLKSETYKQIFSTYPIYSIGWYIVPEENFRYSHRGSNMMFNSFAGISPEKKLGVVIMINSNNDSGITQTLNLLLKNYAKK